MPTETMPAEGATSSTLKDETQLVTFLLQEEEFGFDIMSVQEIIRPPKLAKVPRTPVFVDGIANLRGVVLPVVDMRTRFGLDRGEDTDRTRVLIVDIQGVKTGLRVDRVKQVTRVQRGDIEAPPRAIRGTTADYLQGVVKLDNGERIIMALNAAELCRIGVEREASTAATNSAIQAEEAQAGRSGAVDDNIQQMVTFRIASEEFALPMEQVREILRVAAPKQVPDVPAYVLGVIAVRGQVLPIVDLRQLLGQRSLADEVAGGCREVRAEYEVWLEHVGQSALSADHIRSGLRVVEAARSWLGSISCSSQALMECLAQIRSSNERTARQLQDRGQWRDAAADAAGILSSLREFEKRVPAHIQEDQRVIVVDADGILLGLVVDRVNEVLNISRALTDPPPPLASSGMELAGVARLDGGNRLIMLLNLANLFRDERMRAVRQASSASGPSDGLQKVGAGDEQSRDELQLVTFLLGEEEYGIPISQIQEIDRLSKVTKVPKAARFVEGITNLRGEVIPVVDTRRRFALAEKQDDDSTRIVIVDLAGVKTGLVVDSVREVLSLPVKDIAPAPAGLHAALDQRFISGVGKLGNGKRMIVLLDVAAMLAGAEQAGGISGGVSGEVSGE